MTYLIENILQRMSAISPKEANKDRTSLALDPSKHANQDNIRGQQKNGCC